MSAQRFKLAINNANFPFLFGSASRTVAQPGLDVAPRTSVGFVGDPTRFDYNLISMIYCENVLPTAEGQVSVGFQDAIDAYPGPVTDFDQVLILRDSLERNFTFVPARGKNYLLDPLLATWTSYDSFTFNPLYNLVSRAYVGGRTFIFYESTKLIEWDPIGHSFVTRTLTLPTGYVIDDIRCVIGASNYLVLFSDTEVFWSSSLDIFNFNDPIGKSGRQIPIDLKGQITAAGVISGGFIVYTNRNAVAAFFTNNADTPFSFREVQSSGGIASFEQLTVDANQSEHFIYGSAGLQRLNLQIAELISPDCTDFLAQRKYEAWNSETGEVEKSVLTGSLDVKVQVLANRYFVVSYGLIDGQFTFALFYDLAYRSWGKVRVNHVDISVLPSDVIANRYLAWNELTGNWSEYLVGYDQLKENYGQVIPLRSGFAFLQNTGAMQLLLADPAARVGQGLVILGHVQVVRARTVTFQKASFDGIYSVPAPVLRLLGSLPGNGAERTSVDETTVQRLSPESVQYVGRKTYENFDLALEGKFALTTGLVEVTNHGSR